MTSEPVEFFNRYTQRVEQETIYGESWLRWAYGNALGRVALHALGKRATFSRWYGWRMSRKASRAKIRPFIDRYHVNTSEFADPVESFTTFNEFFHRRLKAAARPIHPDPLSAVFPADGRHRGFADISQIDGVLVKGEIFSLAELLQSSGLANAYASGSMVISRLCPVDYHRFHFPVSGVPSLTKQVEGHLFSVSPIALRIDIRILVRNRRWITRVQTQSWGEMLIIEVGATNVGSAVSTYVPGSDVSKGAEKGYFQFGGSLMICLFLPGKIELAEDLRMQSSRGLELYARMGDVMGHAKH